MDGKKKVLYNTYPLTNLSIELGPCRSLRDDMGSRPGRVVTTSREVSHK